MNKAGIDKNFTTVIKSKRLHSEGLIKCIIGFPDFFLYI